MFALLGAVSLLIVFVVLERTHTINLISPTRKDNSSAQTGNGVNFDPPTKEEQQAGNEQKEEIVEEKEQQEATPPPSPSSKKSVKPAIVSASIIDGQVDVRGFVPGVFEEGGTCTARFTKPGSTPISKTTTGFEDFNKTTCQPFTFPVAQLSGNGDWSITLSYSSGTAEGTSDASTITVQ